MRPFEFEWHAGWNAGGSRPSRLLAWVNDCPLVVDLVPTVQGFRFEVMGHSVGDAPTVRLACVRAVEAALRADRSASTCPYLSAKGGPWGFFADRGATDPRACVAAMLARRRVQGFDAIALGQRALLSLPEGLATT